jgi:hypothetical protein
MHSCVVVVYKVDKRHPLSLQFGRDAIEIDFAERKNIFEVLLKVLAAVEALGDH